MILLNAQANTPIQHFTHMDLCDAETAKSWMTKVCGPHRLDVLSHNSIQFKHTARLLQAATVGYIEYGTDVTIGVGAECTLESYSIELPVQGRQRLESQHGTIWSDCMTGIILSPNASQELYISGNCKKIQLAIPRSLMRAHLELLLNRSVKDDIQFLPTISSVQGAAAGWWRMVRHFTEEACRADSFLENQGMALEIESALVKGLILTQPNNYSADLEKTLSLNVPSYVQRAINYIHQHAREEIKLNEIVACSGVSRLKLFDGFKKHIGLPPMFYIRRYRLGEIRKAIIQDRSNAQISGIALDWGYTHLGRFSSDYRKFFGECPSHTAKRRNAQSVMSAVIPRP
ncbi:AraC family transcriptional regulator [Pseudomonas sp.]|uniref:AraC family transcriptional regulator n=1 Tax=Pseudomonas sp. TaxID=306 RepID=UPI00262879AC|nr:AraC family transcriptional regulator [Pseudomonas sp.]